MTDENRKTLHKIPSSIWVLGFVSMLMDISSELIHSLLPVFLVAVLSASAVTVGLSEGTAEATALIVKVFSGTLSDYLGRRKALAVIGYALGALSKPLVYVASAYPFGKLSDSESHTKLLAVGMLVLIGADLVLAYAESWGVVFLDVALWGLHLGITQGLLARMVADTAPPDRRGTAFGLLNLLSGVTMLVASALAGLLWDRLGPSFTFYGGAFFCAVALLGLAVKGLRDPDSPE